MLRAYVLFAATYVAASASVCAGLEAGGWVRYPLFAPLALLTAGWVAATARARGR